MIGACTLSSVLLYYALCPPPSTLLAYLHACKCMQELVVHESWVSFAACDVCVAAFTSALRVGFPCLPATSISTYGMPCMLAP